MTNEKLFAKKLSKAGWHTYRDAATGRVVTNAYLDERLKLEEISGLSLEVVSMLSADKQSARLGPRSPFEEQPT